ncbi:MAG: Asp-tRNA(Asn)/Glu-tRNA(Gln) amidotransferase subunit GatC [Fibrobacter sp.]|nr:Asp-tRNA(Asn)/Glu-tRNA(Gln) amidotransferase subunit GatC [Fibrobacter sp.]
MIDENRITELAELARIELSEDELTSFSARLQSEVEKATIITKDDLSAVEPMVSAFNNPAFMRADQVKDSMSAERVFQNSQQVEQNHFVVPKIMG